MQSATPSVRKLSYACGTATVPLLGKCIGEVLDDAAAAHPDDDALIVRHQQRRYSYGELRSDVERLARGLMALGIQKGDRVGIWATNCAEWVITQFATAKIGAILVNINPANRAFELEYALRQSECQTLLLMQGFRDADYPNVIREVCPEQEHAQFGELHAERSPELRRLIFMGANCASHDSGQSDHVPKGMLGWSALLEMGINITPEQLRDREITLSFDDAINIQFTSGTTGLPKGATLTHHNVVNNAMLIANAMRFTRRDRLCIPVPFYHCFGMVLGNMACVVSGAAMVVPAPYFDAEATLRVVAEEGCTALHGVPTMFIAELEHPIFAQCDLSSLRTGIMAGSPCPIEVMKRVVSQMHCSELTIAYGLTEASPVITQTTADDPVELRVTTVGKVLPHTEVKIVCPETGATAPLGEEGELYTRGYHVMKGYYKDPEATRGVIDEDGWLRTGDLAVLDERGYFKITGRAKDVIIRGGENISPREIEEFLYTCPGISDVQIIGVPDRKYGEQIAAWIKLEEGASLTAEAIHKFCEGRIARHKIPRYIKFVEEFPITISGKIQKFRMREMATRELGLEADGKIETA
ncbi:MAG: AMP-binding protein [Candidatus Korobacteraceae bacterium]